MADTVLKLVRGNDSDMSVCIQRREGSGEPVPYDLSGAEDVRLSLTGHGIHVFAKNVSVTGASSNIITGRMTGRMLLGVYDLEVTFTLGGMAKRFSIPDLAEVVDHLEDDSDGVAEGEGDGIVVTLIIQPEIIEVAGITRDELNAGLALKVDKVEGKGLSTNDYTDGEKAKLAALPTAETLAGDLDDKVDKVPGKGLSESDFTSGEKAKLAGIAAGAQVNVLETVKVGGAALEVVAKAVNIPVDSAPTAGSGNLATSGGIQAAIKAVRDALALIEAVVPTQASENNQLADKEFVNSSISTSTAEFRGTVNSVAELPTTGVDDNDYAFVVSTDSAGNTVYNRYKFTPSNGWMFEYALNNSSFTSEQWAAIQSGMTAALVTKLKALPTAAALETSLGQKVDKVTGKGLSTEDYTSAEKTKLGALPSAADLSTSLEGKVDKVTGKGLSTEDYTTTEKDKLAGIEEGAQVNLPVDEEPTEGSDNPVSSGGMHAILTPVEEAGAEFLHRVAPVNGKTSLGVTRVKGKTLAFNQRIDTSKPIGNEMADISVTVNNDGSITLNGSTSSGGNIIFADMDESIVGHKAFYSIGKANQYISFSDGYSGSGQGVASFIITQVQLFRLYMTVSAGASFSNDTFYPQVIDLTQMFGAGNEPETLEEFKAMFPLPYYDYNPGELVNVAASGVKTVGFNLWDEEWELGEFVSSGEPKPSTSAIRSAHYIPVLPGKQLYFHNGGIDVFITVVFYDSARNIISVLFESAGGVHDGSIVSCPTDAAYIKIGIAGAYGLIYKHDICVNLSDPDRNGEYEPYKEDIVPLGLDSFKVKDSSGNILEIKGLASAGDMYDERAGGKLVKRTRTVVFDGSESWIMINSIPGVFVLTTLNVVLSDDSQKPECNYYVGVKGSIGIPGNKTCKLLGAGWGFSVNDQNYTTLAGWVAHLNELYAAGTPLTLTYPLVDPVEYDLAEPRAWVAEREDGGTETVLPLDSDPPIVPPILDLKYGDYAEEIAPFLKSDLASAESVKAMLEAMKTAGVISAYTMIWNKSARRYDFTITQ